MKADWACIANLVSPSNVRFFTALDSLAALAELALAEDRKLHLCEFILNPDCISSAPVGMGGAPQRIHYHVRGGDPRASQLPDFSPLCSEAGEDPSE